MAKKRMFAISVIETDKFLGMSPTTQNLYYHLGMRSDDDGFLSNSKAISKMVGASTTDLQLLNAKEYIIVFQSGIIVLTHFLMNNNKIQKDRYKATIYQKELSCLKVNYIDDQKKQAYYTLENQAVIDLFTDCVQVVTEPLPSRDHRLDKIRLDKIRLSNTENNEINNFNSLNEDVSKHITIDPKEVIEHFNKITGKNFRATLDVRKLINDRIEKDNFTDINDFFIVNENIYELYKNNNKFKDFMLTPTKAYGEGFDKWLNLKNGKEEIEDLSIFD